MSGGIYLIKCNANDTIYVGSAKNFEGRFRAHLAELLGGNHRNPHLQHSFNKYGKESLTFIKFKTLGEYVKEEYFAEENSVMTQLRESGQKLFNIAKAEGGWTFATHERKAEIKQKISKTLKDNASKMSEEERKEIFGKGKKDVPLSEERKLELSEYWSGKPKSEETKRRMSRAQKTNPKNKENGRRLGKSNIGKTPPNVRKVMINGIIFNSLKDAADHFKITSSAIHKRIKRNKNGNNSYIS